MTESHKDLAPSGLVEALVALHRPQKTWGSKAHYDHCTECRGEWPCATLVLVAEVTGSPVPERQMSACDGAVPSPDPDGGFRMCHLDRGHEADGTPCQDGDGHRAPWPYRPMETALFEEWSSR